MLVAALLVPALGRADEPPRYRYSPLHVSLVPPLSFPEEEAPRVIGLSLNLPYGRLSGLYGIEAGLINREDGDAAGVQVGGVANWVGRDAWGIQIAGGMNRAAGLCGGICLAGGVNWHSGGGGGIQVAGLFNGSGATWTGQRFVGFAGIQIGGIANFADIFYGLQVNLINNTANNMMGLQIAMTNFVADHFAGIQIGLGGNINAGESGLKRSPLRSSFGFGSGEAATATDDFFSTLFHEPLLADPTIMGFRTYLPRKTQGLQVALILNWADVLQGVQLALFLGSNFVVSQLEGVQISPLGINYAYFDATGMQIALAYNEARTLKGIQVGLVNVCRTLYGVQVGLVNVCRTLHGFQIGVVNVAYENWLPFMIGMNAGF
ncbi:hypothetical protein WME76_33215 [Sorangium sp. So ce119]|uniref:LA_2272 family surface repeat-containing protein n=1 Tax=Sorangium sp. So ce119 TaxID=3133279 RepID=UPI003F6358BB